jgi:tRNA 2-thiouridine synthesizing protein E
LVWSEFISKIPIIKCNKYRFIASVFADIVKNNGKVARAGSCLRTAGAVPDRERADEEEVTMIAVRVAMKFTNEPLKRTPVVLKMDAEDRETEPVLTDRAGIARFDLPPGSGKVLVSGVERFHGRLDGEILVALWSITEAANDSTGTPGEFPSGSNAYPGMTTRSVEVHGRTVLTDSEGYLVNPVDWSEDFARTQAAREGLDLGAEHWEVIRFLRAQYAEHGQQPSVRDMIRHFRKVWDPERGSNRYLHRLFPVGGPQKQGNRLAGLLRTKGEH